MQVSDTFGIYDQLDIIVGGTTSHAGFIHQPPRGPAGTGSRHGPAAGGLRRLAVSTSHREDERQPGALDRRGNDVVGQSVAEPDAERHPHTP